MENIILKFLMSRCVSNRCVLTFCSDKMLRKNFSGVFAERYDKLFKMSKPIVKNFQDFPQS